MVEKPQNTRKAEKQTKGKKLHTTHFSSHTKYEGERELHTQNKLDDGIVDGLDVSCHRRPASIASPPRSSHLNMRTPKIKERRPLCAPPARHTSSLTWITPITFHPTARNVEATTQRSWLGDLAVLVVISEDLSTQFSTCPSTIFLVQKISEFFYLVYKSMMN
ncbi:hypothetical protein GBA52_007077 [Prunus armeniaca]|nr:hypothetical protein GBA52_007077 [Prunus armeniaca]